jgi:hypothetical protein
MSMISAASFGCIDKFDAIRSSASVGILIGGTSDGEKGIPEAGGTRGSEAAGLSPSFLRTSIGVPG